MKDPHWWRQAAVYQIYPRSFSDSNADGLGDLPGITTKVPYLAQLGVDAVWLSPFYPSALADGGYDVDDYRAVDPRLGGLDDFDDLAAALHSGGIKLIVDIVPNHSSNRHAWFQEALASPKGSPARNRYIFRDGTGPGGSLPPSDWQSVFGGSAWEQVPDGQWYLHLFAPEQPDFNWENPEVRAEFLTTLRFWSDRGVDGFRIDVAHALAKDLTEPLAASAELTPEGDGVDGGHPFWDRDEVHQIYAEWRKLFNEYDPPRTAVAEAWVHASRRGRYASPEGLGQAFNFDLLQADFDAARFREVITANLDQAAATGASSTWVLSNHDVVRHATRYGLPPAPAGSKKGQDGKAWVFSGGTEPALDRELGLRRARAATLLMLALPGSAYLYQGEELGLHEVADIPDADRQDPTFHRNAGVDKGRDGCRVPLPWTAEGPSFGFGTGAAHLPQPGDFARAAVSAQEQDGDSTLNFYRRALELRGKQQGPEELLWVRSAATVLHFQRPGGWQSITNFGDAAIELPEGSVLLSSGALEGGLLPPDTTAWLA
ncbi:glycoside hydrolase family 13 protein [Arthrobacter sp. zg-Y1171]|uniref:glycoside hydrolase family 13 protein n=1 Tax=Arthrobacter sp. zg-Y1171 TaxID=2964610 RepID=UPI0021065F93|nr:glycoside hydrolase family 13 protein [Arthrobacter sp. zg-Y1171]MCQ1995459.1 glycoside hydrolase family 13 protein [Arthrobacter sp. zg-Y1171]UWX83423.1 glycoside hydrolase family 13 protein [Arthrobacter sp. zg-Y1171]